MKRLDAWNVAGWVMVVVLAAVGFALGVAASRRWPLPSLLVVSQAIVVVVAWRLPNRALRAELEAVRDRLATYNASETHDALAEARADDQIEVEPFMADSGYRPPVRLCDNRCGTPARWVWDDGVPHAACDGCADLWWPDGIDLLVVTDLTAVASLPPITNNDIEVMRSGFRGYEGCPSGDCTTPFHCSERGDCRRWAEVTEVPRESDFNAWAKLIHDTHGGPRTTPGSER